MTKATLLKYSEEQLQDILNLCVESVDLYRQYREGHGWDAKRARETALRDMASYLESVRKSQEISKP